MYLFIYLFIYLSIDILDKQTHISEYLFLFIY